MRRSSTSSLMALAQGRACSNVVSANDDPPSRWHDAHRLYTNREISRDQVILVEKTSWALSTKLAPTRRETTECLILLATTAIGFIGFVDRREEFPQAHVRRNYDVIEPQHHFFPALLAEADGCGWIRVVNIIGRIVEPGGALDGSSGRNLQRFRQLVIELPEKVVVRNPQ